MASPAIGGSTADFLESTAIAADSIHGSAAAKGSAPDSGAAAREARAFREAGTSGLEAWAAAVGGFGKPPRPSLPSGDLGADEGL